MPGPTHATGFNSNFDLLRFHRLGMGLLEAPEFAWCKERIWVVLHALGPHTWGGDGESVPIEAFTQSTFMELHARAQSVILLMHALVGRP